MEEKLSECRSVLARLLETRVGRDVPRDAPRVSVVIPAYDVSASVAATLDSIFAQSLEDFEIIVVNDGSGDTRDLESVLEGYFGRIVYGRQENLGASEARNAAICLSRGELIAFLDGDDLWLPKYLEEQVAFLDRNGLDMVYCDAELFGDNFFKGKTFMETTPSSGEVTTESLLSGTCNVITSGTLVKKEILDKTNLFDTEAKRAQDFDLWFRVAKSGARIGYQREVLIRYRVSTDSLSGSNVQRAERNTQILKRLRDKYDFSEGEHAVWAKQVAFSEAEVELEKGKTSLVRGEYRDAGDHFEKANEYYRSPKLSFLRL
ncbi:MAG: glycosyltransferase family 2 protein, partial [Acidobacteriota bacterium]|nr:glycosyltransferase family 2 protein [Acidobacteriota bacterium]